MPIMRARKTIDDSTYTGRFALRLQSLRLKAGLDQKQAAELLGVEARTIYRWEDASRQPSIEQLPAIAKAYRVSVRNLFPTK